MRTILSTAEGGKGRVSSMPTLEQLKAAEEKLHEAQHRVFDYVQGLESSSLDPKKYHDLSEAARAAANQYIQLVYDIRSNFKQPK